MPPENEKDRPLREQAKVLSAAVNDMSKQIGNLTNGLIFLRKYGHRNRMLIIVTVMSLLIELSLIVALTIVTLNVIATNHRTSANVGSINCLTREITESLLQISAYNDVSIAVLNLKAKALAKDVTTQTENESVATHNMARIRYLADVAAIDKIKIPPRPVFDPHC